METLHAIEFVADRLNNNRSMDWDNYNQYKYYFYYDKMKGKFYQTCTNRDIVLNTVYCLDNKFLETVISTVGLEKLKELYKVAK